MKYFLFLIFLISCLGCTSEKKDNSSSVQNHKKDSVSKQLNITILLDLSDRIDTSLHPEEPHHYKRDLAIIQHFCNLFVADMENRGAFMAKGKLKIIFSPAPQDPNVNVLAEKLSVNLSSMDNKMKKHIHDNLSEVFSQNLSHIYENTFKRKNKWLGSDIWRFFKNDVRDYCVDEDTSYRNILVLITDGYLFHNDTKSRIKNRYTYLLAENIIGHGLRKNLDWKSEIKKQDFGLISTRKDLQSLEVLALEITPSEGYKNDEDIIKLVLHQWFQEMGISRDAVFNSDLPEYTKQRINGFVQ